jgi:hypothetical protein
MSMPLRIEKIYAWICLDDDDSEGIPAIQIGNMAYPLIGADKERMESYRPFVEAIRKSGKPMKLVEFKDMVTLEEL